jgi:hypothetical protein
MPKTAAVAGGLGVLVLGVVLFGLQNRIRERWYLHKFHQGDVEAKREALEHLGRVGSETSWVALCEYAGHSSPQLLLWWGLYDLSEQQYSLEGLVLSAVLDIEKRIGPAAAQAAILRYLQDSASDSRTRLWHAQRVLLSITPLEKLPPAFQAPGALDTVRYRVPWTNEHELFHEHKLLALTVCLDALSSEDENERLGAVFGLALCMRDSDQAVQALRGVTADPDPDVGKAAAEVLAQLGK